MIEVVFLILVLILVCIIYLLWLNPIRINRRGSFRQDRIPLYFRSHFRDVIREWDIVSVENVKKWNERMNPRLDTIGDEIKKIVDYRKRFEPRIERLESKIEELEII